MSAIDGSGSRWFLGPTWGFSTDLRMSPRTDTHVGQSHTDHGRANPPQKVSGSFCLVKSRCQALPHDQNDIDGGCQGFGVVETQKRRRLDENNLRQVSGRFQHRRHPQRQLPTVRDERNQWDRRDVGQRRRPQGAFKDFWGNRCGRVLAPRAYAITGVQVVGAHNKHRAARRRRMWPQDWSLPAGASLQCPPKPP